MRIKAMFRQPILKAYLWFNWLMGRLLIKLITAYQYLISPWLGNRCRFYPSCSEYAKQAVLEWGVAKGLMLGSWRLLRCHPWHPGGYDPVNQKLKRPASHEL